MGIWLFGSKKKQSKVVKSDLVAISNTAIPKGWYMAEAGQNPLDMLWFAVIVNFDDVANKVDYPRHFFATECDSYEQALQECVKNINKQ